MKWLSDEKEHEYLYDEEMPEETISGYFNAADMSSWKNHQTSKVFRKQNPWELELPSLSVELPRTHSVLRQT